MPPKKRGRQPSIKRGRDVNGSLDDEYPEEETLKSPKKVSKSSKKKRKTETDKTDEEEKKIQDRLMEKSKEIKKRQDRLDDKQEVSEEGKAEIEAKRMGRRR